MVGFSSVTLVFKGWIGIHFKTRFSDLRFSGFASLLLEMITSPNHSQKTNKNHWMTIDFIVISKQSLLG